MIYNDLNKTEKLKKILYLIEKYNITAYEIGKNTNLNTAGIERIIKKAVKNPREETVNILYDYIIKKSNSIANENEQVNEPQEVYSDKLSAMEEIKNCLNERNKLTKEIVRLQILLLKNNIKFKNIFDEDENK